MNPGFVYIGNTIWWDKQILMWECIGWLYARDYSSRLSLRMSYASIYIKMSATIGRLH